MRQEPSNPVLSSRSHIADLDTARGVLLGLRLHSADAGGSTELLGARAASSSSHWTVVEELGISDDPSGRFRARDELLLYVGEQSGRQEAVSKSVGLAR